MRAANSSKFDFVIITDLARLLIGGAVVSGAVVSEAAVSERAEGVLSNAEILKI